MTYVIDTNMFLRFVDTEAHPHHDIAKQFIQDLVESQIKFYTTNIVLLEYYHTLKSFYKHPTTKCDVLINMIVSNPLINIIETTNYPKALALHTRTHIKLTDCLIATQIPKNCTLVTFDHDFDKLPKLKVLHPDARTS